MSVHSVLYEMCNFPFDRLGNTASTDNRLEVSQSGMPWWRRHAELGPGVAETRH